MIDASTARHRWWNEAGEALVRVTLSGICNTDLELARGYMGFRGTLGHELVGVVEHGGGAIPNGTHVVCEINAGCGTCAVCRTGDARHCPTRTDGAHADYLRMPALAVPDQISDRQAVFVEPLAAALGILERRPIEPGERVAIIGDGKLGLLIAMALADRRPLLVGKHPAKMARAGRSRGLPGRVRCRDRGIRHSGASRSRSTCCGRRDHSSSSRHLRVGPSPAPARLPHVTVDRLISDQLADAARPGALKLLLAR